MHRLLLSLATLAVTVLPVMGQDLAVDMTLHRLLIEGEDWKVVAEGHAFTDAPCPDAEGNLYFCDLRGAAAGLYRIGVDGKETRINHHAVSGMKFVPGDAGHLVGCQGAQKRVVLIPSGVFAGNTAPEAEVLATDVQPNDLVVTKAGRVYFTETGKQQVTMLDLKTKQVRAMDMGITGPNGIALSGDEGTLAVSDARGGNVWTFVIGSDGTLSGKTPWMTLRRSIDYKAEYAFHGPPPYLAASGGDGMGRIGLGGGL